MREKSVLESTRIENRERIRLLEQSEYENCYKQATKKLRKSTVLTASVASALDTGKLITRKAKKIIREQLLW